MALNSFQPLKLKMITDTNLLFSTIAHKYERVNDLISFGVNSRWTRTFIGEILEDTWPEHVLDLCCGTAQITRSLLLEMRKRKGTLPTIDGVDFSDAMLAIAHKNLEDPSVRFIQAAAEQLPMASDTYDTICLAYGIRNIQDPKRALEEAWRVLKHEGTLHILELTCPSHPIPRFLHSLYLSTLVPLVGWMITGKVSPYRYLRDSILRFSIQNLLQQLQNAGFQKVVMKRYTLGTIHYIRAQKR